MGVQKSERRFEDDFTRSIHWPFPLRSLRALIVALGEEIELRIDL